LAVQNMSEYLDIVPGAEVCLRQIAFHEIEALADAVFFGNLLRCRDHSRPIDRAHADARRFLGEHNSPNARASGEIYNENFAFRFSDLQMISELLCSGVAHWDNVFHELTEKFGAFGFLIHCDRRTAFADDVSQA